ncbi:MAG: hypothetical protein QF619_12705 [Candidatus Binatia bacterium]|nr:hypothetical protein [Candidatus Binatia bacterium]
MIRSQPTRHKIVQRTILIVPLALLALAFTTYVNRAASLVLEAEDFQVRSGDWKVGDTNENYFSGTFANTFLCGQSFLGAPEQGVYSEAVMDIEIPEDGDYLLWTRYEHPSYFNVEHRVKIEPGAETVFNRMHGNFSNLKLWPFGLEKLQWPMTSDPSEQIR